MNEKRVPNFTSTEKLHLLRIIAHKYGFILEDKKTDWASAEKKEKTWQQITDDFNASSSTGILRGKASLKKCYENRKNELRKTLADEKKEVPPPKIQKRDETDELLISIINKNTLVGFHNKFDDDADESSIVCRDPDESNEVELQRVDEDSTDNTHTGRETCLPIVIAKKDDVNWRKYNATQLQDPISPALVTNVAILKQDKTKQNVRTLKSMMPLFVKLTRNDIQVPDHLKSAPKSRRRPTTVVKSLTSSEIAKKYDLLLDKTLMLLEMQLTHMEQENALRTRQRKLEIEILETDLCLKKKNLE